MKCGQLCNALPGTPPTLSSSASFSIFLSPSSLGLHSQIKYSLLTLLGMRDPGRGVGGEDAPGQVRYAILWKGLEHPQSRVSTGVLEPVPPRIPTDNLYSKMKASAASVFYQVWAKIPPDI